jgi:CheY-like chemotaxis protein
MNNNLKTSIFIVDDDPDDRESIRDAFLENDTQHEYVFLGGAEELLNQLESARAHEYPALILLDLNMPGMDGRDALKHIKGQQQLRHIPIIILSTSSSHIDKQVSYALGANCFVTKPDTFNKLVDLTGSIVRLWVAGA